MDFNRVCDKLQMGQDIISWSHTLKYLGFVFKSARTVVTDVDDTVRKFHAYANAILSHVKYASEMSKLFLVETFCLPVLSYSCESLNFSRKQLSQLNVCWNYIYRKIFHITCGNL